MTIIVSEQQAPTTRFLVARVCPDSLRPGMFDSPFFGLPLIIFFALDLTSESHNPEEIINLLDRLAPCEIPPQTLWVSLIPPSPAHLFADNYSAELSLFSQGVSSPAPRMFFMPKIFLDPWIEKYVFERRGRGMPFYLAPLPICTIQSKQTLRTHKPCPICYLEGQGPWFPKKEGHPLNSPSKQISK